MKTNTLRIILFFPLLFNSLACLNRICGMGGESGYEVKKQLYPGMEEAEHKTQIARYMIVDRQLQIPVKYC